MSPAWRVVVVALALAGARPADPAPLGAGDLVVLDDGGGPGAATARVIGVDATTGAQTVLAELGHATGFDVAPNGDLLVADYQSDEIVRLDRQTQASTVVSAGELLRNPTHLAVGADGSLFAIDEGEQVSSPGDDFIVRIDPGTGAQAMVASGGAFGVLRGLAVAPNGDLFVLDLGAAVASGGDEKIIRVNPGTGEQTVILTGAPLAVPNDGFVRADGRLVVVDGDALASKRGAIFAVDPQSGAATIVSQATPYSNPRSAAPVPGSGDLFVLDAGVGEQPGDERLFRVDLATDTASILSENQSFAQPWRLRVLGTPTCGNGRRDFGEQCDDGAANGAPTSCCTVRCVVGSNGAPCADVQQVVENGVPQPAVSVDCRLPAGKTTGRCRAKLVTAKIGATASVAALVDAAAARRPKQIAVSRPAKAPIKSGFVQLRLRLSPRGQQLLADSPGDVLVVEVRGIVRGPGVRAKISKQLSLRRF